jgi:Complex 1 protein (LYR family)
MPSPLSIGTALPTRSKTLSLYRQLLRGATKMPTPNRQKFVVKKTRSEFKANRDLTDPSDIEFCLRLADTNLDTVLLQADHLTSLMKDKNYHADL